MTKLGEQVRMVQVAYIEEGLMEQSEIAQESLQQERKKAKKKKRVVLDVKSGANNQTFLTFDYQVDLPIGIGIVVGKQVVQQDSTSGISSSSRSAVSSRVGLSLRQIQNGELSENSLDLDTLRYVSLEEMVMRQQKLKCFSFTTEDLLTEDGAEKGYSMQILNEKKIQDVVSSGIVVSSVEVGGIAWDLGIRAGDLLVATSATMGDVSVSCAC
jgi:hypothetical protein